MHGQQNVKNWLHYVTKEEGFYDRGNEKVFGPYDAITHKMSVCLQLIYQYGSVTWQYACLCEHCEQGGRIYCLDCEIYF